MDCRQKLNELLALEYNCSPDAFSSFEHTITTPALHEGRRRYSSEPYFFHMTTTGRGAVFTADERLHPFLREFSAGKEGHRLFEYQKQLELERELNKFGHTLSGSVHMYLPTEEKAEISRDFAVKWYFDDEIGPFYGHGWWNAIANPFNPERPDRVCVAAFDGDKIMGLAGASEDAPSWLQIGIDVLPEYRSRGVGAHLVALLKNKILERGEIPFYGTAIANYHSINIAIKCGFYPAWIEIGSQPIAE